MSQNIFPNIDPYTTSGIELASMLNAFKDAVVSGLIGPTRPVALVKGGVWVKEEVDYLVLNLFDGTADIPLLQIDKDTGGLYNIALAETPDKYDVSEKVANTEFVRKNTVAQLQALTSSVNLNSIVSNSVTVQSLGESDLGNNYPVVEDGVLVTVGGDSRVSQTYYTAAGSHSRTYIEGTGWGAWVKEVVTSDVTSLISSAISGLGKIVSGPASTNIDRLAVWSTNTGDGLKNSNIQVSGSQIGGFAGLLEVTGILKANCLAFQPSEVNSTGEDVALNVQQNSLVHLNNSGLESVAGLSNVYIGSVLYILNLTGSDVVLKHNSAGVLMPFFFSNEENLTLKDKEIASFITHDTSVKAYYVGLNTGGGGGGSGATSNLDTLFVEDFENTGIDKYTVQGNAGNIEISDISPLHGSKSLVITHTGSEDSDDDVEISYDLPVDPKFRNQPTEISASITSDAQYGDLTFSIINRSVPSAIVNDAVLSSTNGVFKATFNIPSNCLELGWVIKSSTSDVAGSTKIDDIKIVKKDNDLIYGGGSLTRAGSNQSLNVNMNVNVKRLSTTPQYAMLTGDDEIIDLDSGGMVNTISSGATSIKGTSGTAYSTGEEFTISHGSIDPVILKHNMAGTGFLKFYFPDGKDRILNRTEVIKFVATGYGWTPIDAKIAPSFITMTSNTIDWNLGEIYYYNLIANTTFVFANTAIGKCITLIINNSTGGALNIGFTESYIKKPSDFPTNVAAGKVTAVTFISTDTMVLAVAVKDLA